MLSTEYGRANYMLLEPLTADGNTDDCSVAADAITNTCDLEHTYFPRRAVFRQRKGTMVPLRWYVNKVPEEITSLTKCKLLFEPDVVEVRLGTPARSLFGGQELPHAARRRASMLVASGSEVNGDNENKTMSNPESISGSNNVDKLDNHNFSNIYGDNLGNDDNGYKESDSTCAMDVQVHLHLPADILEDLYTPPPSPKPQRDADSNNLLDVGIQSIHSGLHMNTNNTINVIDSGDDMMDFELALDAEALPAEYDLSSLDPRFSRPGLWSYNDPSLGYGTVEDADDDDIFMSFGRQSFDEGVLSTA